MLKRMDKNKNTDKGIRISVSRRETYGTNSEQDTKKKGHSWKEIQRKECEEIKGWKLFIHWFMTEIMLEDEEKAFLHWH
jgi:hypothetical protein